MKLETIKLSDLNPAEYNPRTITKEEFEGLKKSLETFGQQENLIVNKDMTVISGHQRLEAMKVLGWTEAVCNMVDLDKHQEKKLNVIMNSTAISGKYDDLKLAEILEELKLDDDYESLRLNILEPLDLSDVEVEEDEAPEVSSEPPVSKLDEVYQLGRHRVMCGDSTDKANVELLMNGTKADMVFTDPPYGMDFQSNFREKTPQFDKIKNDDVVLDIAPMLDGLMNSDTVAYICTRWDLYPQWYEQIGSIFKIKNCVVWYKKGGGLGDLNNSYSPNHEFIIVAHKGTGNLRGKRDADVWQIERDGFNDYTHPTQKPVALSAFAINHHSDKEQKIVDLFLGSGSTLIACEQTDRTCYGMELDPKYVDVIRKRYWKFTHDGNEEGWEDGTTN